MADRGLTLEQDSVSTKSLFSDAGYNRLFVVKAPQRRYKWTKEQVKQLWVDICNAREKNVPWYFLGTLLLEPLPDQRVSIIDGQQRIATISLLLAVLRDLCQAAGGDEYSYRSVDLQKLIARVDNSGKPVGNLVVKLQDQDNAKYDELVRVQGSTTTLPTPESRRDRVILNTIELNKMVLDHLEKAAALGNDDELAKLCNYVIDGVKFLPIEVASEEQAYLVFDTTNTRGLPLSPGESLKARLAVVSRDDPQLARNLVEGWDSAADHLERAGLGFEGMDDYILAIWSSKQGRHITKRLLANAVLRNINLQRETAADLVGHIKSYVSHYVNVLRPTGTGNSVEDVKDVARLGMSQANGFLTMVHYHANSQFYEAVRVTLALQVRNITIGPQQANIFQDDWPHWANLVRCGNVSIALEEIRAKMIPDDQFRTAFADARVKTAGIARHLLRRLDPLSNKSGAVVAEVDREHIFPLSVVRKLAVEKPLTKNVRTWIQDMGFPVPSNPMENQKLGRQLEKFQDLLGNQALLHEHPNRKAKDQPFATKKQGYEGQASKLTKELSDLPVWNPEQIRARQKRFADQAPEIWTK